MKPLFAALSFLSILPVPRRWTGAAQELASSVKYFPVVGLIMGAVIALVSWALGFVMPRLPLAAVVVLGLAVLTRGLHLDGLADAADGFWSNSSRERMLEIMRDSYTGAMGVVAVVGAMILKFACLAAVGGADLWASVLLVVVCGRCAMVLPLSLFPYARKEGGLADLFFQKPTMLNAVWSVLFALASGWLLLGLTGLAAGVAGMLLTIAFCFYCKIKIGGVTGDTIGATCEITEAATILIIASMVAG